MLTYWSNTRTPVEYARLPRATFYVDAFHTSPTMFISRSLLKNSGSTDDFSSTNHSGIEHRLGDKHH